MRKPDVFDVVFVYFDFIDGSGGKHRPALVIDNTDDLVVAEITSHRVRNYDPGDVRILKWEFCGLDGPSTIRFSHTIVIPASKIPTIHIFGHLHTADINAINYRKRSLPNGDKIMLKEFVGMRFGQNTDLSEVKALVVDLGSAIGNGGDIVDYENTVGGCMVITFEVSGDWKHDHLYFNNLVQKFFNESDKYMLLKIDEEEIGESFGDSYDSYHKVYVCHAEDEEDIVSMGELFEVAYTKDEDIPKQTGIAYKVFRVKNGKLYPPMVSNLGGTDTPVGVWLDAEEGEFGGLSKTGRLQVKSSQGGTLAYRPGYHLGDVPRAPQFDRLNKETGEYEFPKDFVWGECEYAMDVNYQDEADEQGYMRTKGDGTTYRSDKYQHSLAGLKKLPKGGYYKYRTNPRPDTVPWVITGQIKVNRLLSDYEVNEILRSKGIDPIHRQGGDKTLAELGLNGRGISEGVKLSTEAILDNAVMAEDRVLLRQYNVVDIDYRESVAELDSIDIDGYSTQVFLDSLLDNYNLYNSEGDCIHVASVDTEEHEDTELDKFWGNVDTSSHAVPADEFLDFLHQCERFW